MEEKRFTPGPWGVVDDDHHELGTDSSVLIESTSRGITLAIVGPGDSTTYTEDMVNAQLIAAAPELLEALQTYMSAVKRMNEAMIDGCNVQGAMSALIGSEDMANAAIAKALGKE
ncbi:hypothetical protein [Kluyvera intermedia]|uniref:hypothetical protein n=1 Tax=Kluyvera intermedia TaxID=61648 RepID=UPI00370A6656